MALSKEEIENIRHETQKIESDIEKNTIEKPKNTGTESGTSFFGNKKILLVSIVSIVFVLIAVGFGYSFVNSKKPAALDGFAQCLTEKGAIMYGASFCQYTHAQKGMFGNSLRFIDSRDFTEDPKIRVTPTWLINGNYYENAQSLDKLAAITGCVIGG